MDWEECNKKRFVKRIIIDKKLVKSLIESSKDRFVSASLLDLNEVTSSSIIILYYDSLRELLEALAIRNKYKIYNHECYTCFLKEILREEELSQKYDRIRKIRNSINYYGKKLSIDESKIVINDIKELIEKSKKLLNINFRIR